MVGFLEKYHADAILEASKVTSQKKNWRKIAKKHYEGLTKKFKASMENLDTSAEEPKVSEATSAGTSYVKIVPSEAHLLTIDNNSSIPSSTIISSTPFLMFWN